MEQEIIDIIKENIKNKNEHFVIYSSQAYYQLLREVFDQEPSLLIYYKSFSVKHHEKQIDVTMTYKEEASNMDDIIIDDGNYSLMNYTSSQAPEKICIISKDEKKVLKRIKKSFNDFYTNYEGLYSYQVMETSFGILTKYKVIILLFDYCIPLSQLNEKLKEADFKAKQIAYELTRGITMPSAVKAFLALSYLQQNTIYDHDALDDILTDVHAIKNNPYPHISYGPLIENRGICSGNSHAFKRIMNYMGEECYVINGQIRQIVLMNHAWNLIKIDHQYYHIDMTYDIQEGVCLRGFMKDDKHIKGHKWNKKAFPQAEGSYYNSDYVKRWLDEHGLELIEAGIDKKYIFPQKIIE